VLSYEHKKYLEDKLKHYDYMYNFLGSDKNERDVEVKLKHIRIL
jgi:hypothetical protein